MRGGMESKPRGDRRCLFVGSPWPAQLVSELRKADAKNGRRQPKLSDRDILILAFRISQITYSVRPNVRASDCRKISLGACKYMFSSRDRLR